MVCLKLNLDWNCLRSVNQARIVIINRFYLKKSTKIIKILNKKNTKKKTIFSENNFLKI